MKLLRGYLTILFILALLLASDPIQRIIIAPWVRLFPSSRIRVLNRWQKLMAMICTRPAVFIGGVHFPPVPKIPGEPGVLILMNHQSVFDIPLLVKATDGAYPLVITRKRYLRWIPLISHMVRLYQYPWVDPTANSEVMKRSLRTIKNAAKNTDVPMAIFPEGTRSKDGEIGRFRPRGLQLILKQRAWKVHVMVVDGFWERAKMKHFIRGMGDIQGHLTYLGVFDWDTPGEDSSAFIEDIRTRMVDALAEMRETAAV